MQERDIDNRTHAQLESLYGRKDHGNRPVHHEGNVDDLDGLQLRRPHSFCSLNLRNHDVTVSLVHTGVGCSVRQQRCGEERPRDSHVTDRDCPMRRGHLRKGLRQRPSCRGGLLSPWGFVRSTWLHHSCDAEPPPVPSARSSARVARTSGAGGPCAAEQRHHTNHGHA